MKSGIRHLMLAETGDRRKGTMMNVNSLGILLKRFANAKDLSAGKDIHDYVISRGLERDRFLGNLLVNMYGKCGALQDARRVFDNMQKRNLFTWNIMISAYVSHKDLESALDLFFQMSARDVVSWNTIIWALAQHGRLKEAFLFFQTMPERDIQSWTAILSAYIQQGKFKEAILFFNEMPEKDTVSWTQLISAYGQQGKIQEALFLFEHMPQKDVVSWTAVLSACAQQGHLKQARDFFQKMPQRDVVAWNAMIAAYAHHGLGKGTLELFSEMQKDGIKSDDISFVSLLSACSHSGLIDEGCHLLVSMVGDYGIKPAVEHYNCIIDLPARCGRLDVAEALMNNMPSQPNPASWTALLTSSNSCHDIGRGTWAAERAIEMDPGNAAAYISLANIHGTSTNEGH